MQCARRRFHIEKVVLEGSQNAVSEVLIEDGDKGDSTSGALARPGMGWLMRKDGMKYIV